MNKNELFLKTIFCCSACDGIIAPEEVALVKKIIAETSIFSNINVEDKLNQYVDEINRNSQPFLKNFLWELDNTELSESEQLTLIELSIQMIEADEQVLYSEIQFFKKLRNKLSITDEKILNSFPEIEGYLLPDIMRDEKELDWNNISFSTITLNP